MSEYGWTEQYIMDELDGAKGWAYCNWSIEAEARRYGSGVKMVGDGYIAIERKRLKKLAQ